MAQIKPRSGSSQVARDVREPGGAGRIGQEDPGLAPSPWRRCSSDPSTVPVESDSLTPVGSARRPRFLNSGGGFAGCAVLTCDPRGGGGCASARARCRPPPRGRSARRRPRSARRRHRRAESSSDPCGGWVAPRLRARIAPASGAGAGRRAAVSLSVRRRFARALRPEPAHDLAAVVLLEDLEDERRALRGAVGRRACGSARAGRPVSSRPPGAVSVARRTVTPWRLVVNRQPRSAIAFDRRHTTRHLNDDALGRGVRRVHSAPRR